jgi:Laminin EGF domain
VGSDSTQVCSQETGQCECRPGVGGLTCNQCLDNHYGFSVNGCESKIPILIVVALETVERRQDMPSTVSIYCAVSRFTKVNIDYQAPPDISR